MPPFRMFDHVQLAMPKGEEARARFEDGLAHVYVDDPFGNRIELLG